MAHFITKTLLKPRYSFPVAHQSIYIQSISARPTTTCWLKFTKLGRCFSITRALPSSDLGTKADMEKAMNEIEGLFGAAKEEMEYAEESHGSVYYREDHDTARKAVEECLEAYDCFLKDLPTDVMRQEVQGKVGMKLKELKTAFDALPVDDH